MGKEATIGLFGIVSEAKERQKKLDEYRQQVPAPTSCSDAVSKLIKLQELNADVDRRIASEGNNRPKEREKYAISTLISDYTQYYNSNLCATDPIKSAVVQPGDSEINAPVNTMPVSGPSTQIPTWMWYAGAGVLALALIVVVLIKKD
jgi:hypothetical protein